MKGLYLAETRIKKITTDERYLYLEPT